MMMGMAKRNIRHPCSACRALRVSNLCWVICAPSSPEWSAQNAACILKETAICRRPCPLHPLPRPSNFKDVATEFESGNQSIDL